MSFRRQRGILVLLAFYALLVSSCDSKRYFEENKTLEKGLWKREDRVRFTVPVTDTVARYDFFLNVRNDGEYPFSNLYFFIQTLFPDGKTARDTVEVRLADDYGKWLGTGMSSMKYNRFLFQEKVRLPLRGNYTFTFEQAMRVPELKGIRDIGLRIEKAE
jgi:gliding motility-associated lipoprotein GldH